MLLERIRKGLAWRWHIAVRKRYLRRMFRNGEEMVQSYLVKARCDQAICRDGLVIRHPVGRVGLAQMILEIWFDQAYTADLPQLRPGDVVIDAGANIGVFSLWIARQHPGCRVFAFEPFEENYRLLQENLGAAGASNVRTFQMGLAGASGVGAMVDGGTRSQDHRLTTVPANAGAGPVVRTCSFADVLAMAGTPQVALFKCDIEGAEYELFERAEDQDLGRVQRYAIEYHDNLHPGTLKMLENRLRPTHEVTVRSGGPRGYGLLHATLKSIPRSCGR